MKIKSSTLPFVVILLPFWGITFSADWCGERGGDSCSYLEHQEVGDAVYRDLSQDGETGLASLFQHAGLVYGYLSGTLNVLHANSLASLFNIGHAVHYEAFVGGSGGFHNNSKGATYYGAYNSNGLTAADRQDIISYAVQMEADNDVDYTFANALDRDSFIHFPLDVSEIDDIRCDGVVEYCYEKAGKFVWGWNGQYWNITSSDTNLDKHNDMPDLTNGDTSDGMIADPYTELSPRSQHGGFGNKNTLLVRSVPKSPVALYSVAGVQGDNGWYRSDVEIRLKAKDESGIRYIRYRVRSGSWVTYKAPFTLTETGAVSFFALDMAGNYPRLADSVTIRIDKLRPTVSMAGPCSSACTTGLATIQITGSAVDSGASGLKVVEVRNATTKVTRSVVPAGDGSYAVPDLPLNPGANTVTATARDRAGNVSNVFTITVTRLQDPIISGLVRTPSGQGLPGVTLNFSRGIGKVFTSGAGSYSRRVPRGWQGSITPSLVGYVFNPVARAYSSVTKDLVHQNFTATEKKVKISGWVRTANGTGLANITLTLGGVGFGANVRTDSSGYFEKLIPYGWSGTLTPSSALHTFTPPSRQYAGVTRDEPNQNFTASSSKIVISGFVLTPAGSSVRGVLLTFSNGGGQTMTNPAGAYRMELPHGWSGTVTPAMRDALFRPGSRNYPRLNRDQTGQDYEVELPAIIVTAANGGETWYAGRAARVLWKRSGDVGATVRIDLFKGKAFHGTIAASTANDGSHTWAIPLNQAEGADYQIRIASTTKPLYTDLSDRDFSIFQDVDCNGNGIPDQKEVADGTSRDCNGNGVPDECDIRGGTSQDCNDNEIPDECDVVAEFRLDAAVHRTIPGMPRDTVAADLDGDGDLDVAVAQDSSDRLLLLWNDGKGNFPRALEIPVGSQPFTVITEDLDGDQTADLVLANFHAGTISVLTNTGNGAFRVSGFAAGDRPIGLAAGYLDADSLPDVAVTNYGSGDVTVFLNDGAGGLQSGSTFAVGSAPISVATGDLDGDGDEDLAVANSGSGDATVLLNDGTGAFPRFLRLASVGAEPKSVITGDLDGDGNLDLAIANHGSNDVKVMLNEGDGRLGQLNSFSLPTDGVETFSLAAGDLNNDRHLDLAVVNFASDDMTVLLNRSDGSFDRAGRFAVERQPNSLLMADLDGNGVVDLAVSNRASRSLSVILNRTPVPFSLDENGNGIPDECDREPVPFRRGDANCDGQVTQEDGEFILQYLTGLGPEPCCLDAADANDDGIIDRVDSLHVLNYTTIDGPPPAEPGPCACGADPTDDGLDCASYPTELCDIPCKRGVGPFRRGDCNGDGKFAGQVTDMIFLAAWLFQGGPEPPCRAACDFNGDGHVIGSVTDIIAMAAYNFQGGVAGPHPMFPACGYSLRDEDLSVGCQTPLESCP